MLEIGIEPPALEGAGALGGGLQPEELLLEAVEAPWRETSFGESSDEEVVVGSSLYPGELAPKNLDKSSGSCSVGSLDGCRWRVHEVRRW